MAIKQIKATIRQIIVHLLKFGKKSNIFMNNFSYGPLAMANSLASLLLMEIRAGKRRRYLVNDGASVPVVVVANTRKRSIGGVW